MFRRIIIPPDWQHAYEINQRHTEKNLVVAASWTGIIVTAISLIFHEFRGVHGNLHNLETLVRMPVALVATVILIIINSPRLHVRPVFLISGLTLTVMVMALSLFLIHALHSPTTLHQSANVMMICFFAVSVLSIRGYRQWLMIFMAPLLLFFCIMWVQGLSIRQHIPFLFSPLMMIFVGAAVCRALNQLRRSEFVSSQQLKNMASTDQLTGLLNRHAAHTSLEQLKTRHARHGHPFCLIMGDLDNFKYVNDICGHHTGDEVLKETARRLKDAIRNGDIICRWGGEELLVVLPDTGLGSAMAVAEKLRAAISDYAIEVGSVTLEQTISLGVACHRDGESLTATIVRADNGTYLAKKKGRNCIANVEKGNPDQPSSLHVLGQTP